MHIEFTKRQWLLIIKALGYLCEDTDDMLEFYDLKALISKIRNRLK